MIISNFITLIQQPSDYVDFGLIDHFSVVEYLIIFLIFHDSRPYGIEKKCDIRLLLIPNPQISVLF